MSHNKLSLGKMEAAMVVFCIIRRRPLEHIDYRSGYKRKAEELRGDIGAIR
jgi:hypothetical protein